MNATTFSGIYPMQFAFFDAHGHLDREAMRRQVEACVAGGAHGIAILGLATEVSKLAEAERRTVLDWAVEDVAGRVPLAVTVFGNSIEQQSAFVGAAEAAGADWTILQPPPVRGLPESQYVEFFSAVMAKATRPIAIQNAPEYIGIGVSPAGLNVLRARHENFTVLKGEGPAVTIRRVVEETEGALAVFNGRGGLELPDMLRAGCAGMIPSPDSFDTQVRIYDLMRSGRPEDEQAAERAYREILPGIVFMMQSIDDLLCYGKRIAARRIGLDEVHDRAPAIAPTPYGLDCVARFAAALGPLPGG